jgi:glutamate synthase domain-containing protein 2
MVYRIASGADLCNSARAIMMAVGCVQSKQCDVNTCPTGVATQNLRLQKGLVVDVKKNQVANYHRNTINSFLSIVGAMGLSNPNELRPEHIMRRVSEHESKHLSEIYEYLQKGSLLGDKIPAIYAHDWQRASAESF